LVMVSPRLDTDRHFGSGTMPLPGSMSHWTLEQPLTRTRSRAT